jgi:hypothetical protein
LCFSSPNAFAAFNFTHLVGHSQPLVYPAEGRFWCALHPFLLLLLLPT